MTGTEFATEFDVLYNNITSNQAPGLNAYEKSVFLTKAQSQLIEEYFNIRVDGSNGGFDGSPKRQIDFSSLIKYATPTIDNSGGKFDKRAIKYILPSDVLYILDEQLFSNNEASYSIVPISYAEYNTLMSKPYKFPPKNQVWRLITNNTGGVKTQHDAVENYSVLPIRVPIHLYDRSEDGKTMTTTLAGYLTHTIEEEAYFVLYFYNSGNMEIDFSIDGKPISKEFIIPIDLSEINDPEKFIQNREELIKRSLAIYQKEFGLQIEMEINHIDVSSATWIFQTVRDNRPCGIVLNSMPAPRIITSCSVKETIIPAPDTTSIIVELIGRNLGTDIEYNIRYVKKPKPIILEDIESYGVSIDEEKVQTECELPASMHHEILERAVTLAKIAWQGATMTQTALAVQSGK